MGRGGRASGVLLEWEEAEEGVGVEVLDASG